MKLVSTLMLGVALAIGTAAVPALAQKKEKPAKDAAPAMQLSKGFRAAAAPVQQAIQAQNFAGALAALPAADAAAASPDEKFVAAQFRYQIATTQKDTAAQSVAIDAMLNSGGAPATIAPDLYLAGGNAAYQAGNYQRAIQLLDEARKRGNQKPDVALLLAEANFKLNQVPQGLTYVEQVIASEATAGRKAPETWYARAASVAYKAKNWPAVAKWTTAQVRAYPTKENWRSALVTYRDGNKLDGQVQLDLMRLMRATGSLAGERDYFEYAAMASERGLPGEAKAVIDEGSADAKVSTSRPINELKAAASAKVASDRASLAASERQANAAANGRVASATADAYLGYGDNAKAAELYRVALTKGQVDADAVNMRLGIALTRLGQKDAAREAFKKVSPGPRADIASYWLLWLDLQTA